MSEPFLAEVRMMGFNFAPRGWAFLDGQILPINQNQSLYSLLGTTYGGDGRTSFALPEMRGRTPIHQANTHPLGQRAGEETVVLTTNTMPSHAHDAHATSTAVDTASPADALLGAFVAPAAGYHDPAPATRTTLHEGTVGNTGGNTGHNNLQPFLAVNFCIALQGLFPSRN